MSRRRGQAASSSDIPDWLAVFVDTTQAQVQTSQRHIQALIERLEQQEEQSKEAATALQHQLAATASASPAPSQPASTPPSRPTSAPSPPKLTPGISLREFRAWRATWTDYFELTDGRHLSAERQLALFRTCLSPEMRATLGHTIPTKQTLADQLDEIALHFQRQRNVALYRVHFEQRQQQPGEPFDNFYVALRELATDAELCGTCLDTRLTTGIMSGVRSEDVRKKLLALTPFPQLQAVVALCRSEESASNTEADLSAKPALNAATRKPGAQRRSQTSLSGPRTTQDKASSSPSAGSPALCRYCGGRPHRSRSDCPAYGKTCSLCNRRHHFPRVCESKDKPRALPTRSGQQQRDTHAQQPKQRIASLGTRALTTQRTRPSPQVSVTLFTNDGERSLGTHVATPDTGADATVIGRQQFLALGLSLADLQPPLHDEVVVANGETLPCLGTYPLQIRLGQRSTVDRVAVFDSVDGILLAWFVVRDLGLIPSNFPEPLPLSVDKIAVPPSSPPSDWDWLSSLSVADPAHRARAHTQLLTELADVLRDPADFTDEDVLPPMRGPPMTIHLTDDAQPFFQSAARPMPYAWRADGAALLQRMVQQGIIAPLTSDEPSDWQHPITFTPKASGGLRACCDLRRLNQFVRRPTHPCPTPRDAVSQISPGASLFTTMDALSGYWQIPLAEESQALTTFITPWGRYRYLRAPMGLRSAGDEYDRRGDMAFSGISHLAKIRDDILTWDTSFSEHVHRVRQVLLRCREHGITLNKRKFVFAVADTSFCGYNLRPAGIAADPAKLRAISEFPAPTNITELRSFLGLVNQLGDFTADIASSAEDLRGLLRPKNVLVCNGRARNACRSLGNEEVSCLPPWSADVLTRDRPPTAASDPRPVHPRRHREPAPSTHEGTYGTVQLHHHLATRKAARHPRRPLARAGG